VKNLVCQNKTFELNSKGNRELRHFKAKKWQSDWLKKITLTTLQWFPISCRIKSKILLMLKALHANHWLSLKGCSALASLAFLLYPPQGLCTCYSLYLDHRAAQHALSVSLRTVSRYFLTWETFPVTWHKRARYDCHQPTMFFLYSPLGTYCIRTDTLMYPQYILSITRLLVIVISRQGN
jgi:hypothetical protein